jgi:hypothetical protein
MNVNVATAVATGPAADSAAAAAAKRLAARQPAAGQPGAERPEDAELRKAFDDVVGELLFGAMLKAMRKTVGKPAYFHGGRAEEIFTQRLDLELTKKLTAASAHQISGPMYELFTLPRQ